MIKYTNLKDIKNNKLYVGNIVKIKRKNITELATIIDKSHQFKKIYFMQTDKTLQLIPLNEYFIQTLHIEKI